MNGIITAVRGCPIGHLLQPIFTAIDHHYVDTWFNVINQCLIIGYRGVNKGNLFTHCCSLVIG